ncbi:vanadium-dependent haloperoxidase [Archangium sp.]|uniref:vanadium-dependent haloperoxidase n=1 Tax=Archangium sp. TaxID=1872627 RepID=UPI002D2A8A27|nr:vanadium-dependent haloperoxidase [Archangium sp.]HYO52181.1 vanadium-dependent haloperoxidase [Archangium sp.]
MHRLSNWSMGLLAVLALAGCRRAPEEISSKESNRAVLEWSSISGAIVPPVFGGFVPHSREVALTHVAMHDAINSIRPRYETYGPPVAASPEASPEVAAIAAAHDMLVRLHPERQAELDERYSTSLAAFPDSPRKTEGIQVGKAAAAQLWNLRADDRANDAPTYVAPSPAQGVWRQVPPWSEQGLHPNTFMGQWSGVRTWSIQSAAEFRCPPPPAFTSELFVRDVEEVRRLGARTGAVRTQDQTDAGLFWAPITPSSLAIDVGHAMATRKGLDLVDTARALALGSMAGADAMIVNFNSKQAYNFWRPITVIREGSSGVTADPTWVPFLDTPPNQEYPAGHTQLSSAVLNTYAQLFGSEPFAEPLVLRTVQGKERSFSSFQQMVDDVVLARVVGGMHFRNSGAVGAEWGRRIADWVTSHSLQPKAN